MPRSRTGTAYTKNGKIYVGIRLRNGRKWARPWDGGKAGNPVDLRRAKAAAAELQHQYDVREWDPETSATQERAPSGETLEVYAERWLVGASWQGRMNQSVKIRPRSIDSRPRSLGGTVAREQDGEALRQHTSKGGCATFQVAA